MRPCGIITLVVVLLLTAGAQDDTANKDLAKFQGDWSLISAQNDGKAMPEEEVKEHKLTIQGNKFVLRKGSVVISEGTFTLDPAKKPKQIDEMLTAGPSQGKVFLAIYEIDESHHRICFAAAGKERPKALSS